MPREDPKIKRRFPRVETPLGVWAAWQAGAEKRVSRVRDLNVGGVYIDDAVTAPLGSAVSVLLSVPEGEIRSDALVRNVKVGKGMGLEFTKMSEVTRARLHALVSRLLQASPNATA
jgi:hypothetical protein